MTASLYQSGSAGAATAGVSVRSGTSSSTAAFLSTRSSMRGRPSEEVVEVAFGPHPAAQAQDVRRQSLGVELHEVPPALPDVARVGQEVMHLERALLLEAERGRVELDPARMRVVRVEVDDDHDHVREVGRVL